MKLMTIALLSAALMTSAVPALADSQQHPRAERFTYIFEQLELTDAEREQVREVMREVMQERREMMRAARTAGAERPSREDRQQARAEARETLTYRLGEVISAEQVDGLLTYMDAHRGERGHARQHRGKRGEWRSR
ncbi:hypothetical protein [Marinimicrobium alkaliphilum]|uniref:hypothetical protein n=1 Tax=Marinimicrobium alkaliphilum TaxID=2202654 RepID=UPI000DBA843D|nr:hypothetical protein [Marinimicrobium alkaliphilum]